MAEIVGTLSRSGEIQGPCVWCNSPSTSRAVAPGLGVEVPIHILCAAVIVRLFNESQSRGIESGNMDRLRLYADRVRALGPGE